MKMRIYIITALVIMAMASCTTNFEDINTNPNYPETSDPEYIFNYVVKEAAGEYGYLTTYNYSNVQRWVMMTSVVWGNSTMPPYTLFDDIRITNLWKYMYSDLLLNTEVLVKMTAEDVEDNNRHQVARIWKIYCFHKITDLWGDVPYSQAWKLLDEYSEASREPAYDSQEDIYTSMLEELKEAATAINPAAVFYENDMIFGGDLDLWVRFANSLRLRLAVRSGNQAVVQELVAENKLMSSVEESALFTYIESQSWWNPYYELNRDSQNPNLPDYTGINVPRISKLLTDQMKQTGDPRLEIFAQPIEINNSTITGVPNLVNAIVKENQALGLSLYNTSYMGRYFSENPTLTRQLLSHAEVCFLRSEAALRAWTSDDAQQWYEAGVRSSMEHYQVESADIDAFLSGAGAFDNTLEQVLTQKWLALFPDGWEGFAEYRRTGFPQLMKYDLVLDGNSKIIDSTWVEVPRNYVPGRLPYPSLEFSLNGANFEEAVNRQWGAGENYYKRQLWWSRKFGEIDYNEDVY